MITIQTCSEPPSPLPINGEFFEEANSLGQVPRSTKRIAAAHAIMKMKMKIYFIKRKINHKMLETL
jgi:hypothetical protein